MRPIIAVDFGAGSGRVFKGEFNGEVIRTEEIYRFENRISSSNGRLSWDIEFLLRHLLYGLQIAARDTTEVSLALDTWGLDFGLLDENGQLLQSPMHHRDGQHKRGAVIVKRDFDTHSLFARTGVSFSHMNTLSQLLALRDRHPQLMNRCRRLLMMPDLLTYLLTGFEISEYTIATSSQLIHCEERNWDRALVDKLGLDQGWFGDVVQPGTILGDLRASVAAETGLLRTQVIASGSHDTASAVAAAPAADRPFAFISCGTWSLVGVETAAPCLTAAARDFGLSNEGGVDGSFHLIKNISGLWALQCVLREWAALHGDWSYERVLAEAENCADFGVCVNPNDAGFLAPHNMIWRIQEYCTKRGLKVPQSIGEIVRGILEGLAFEHKTVVLQLEEVIGRRFPSIHVVGGGSRNRLICQWTANATGKTVIAGPAEATSIGNMLVQLKALGEVETLNEMRQVVQRSESVQIYEPRDVAIWDEQYMYYKRITMGGGELG